MNVLRGLNVGLSDAVADQFGKKEIRFDSASSNRTAPSGKPREKARPYR